MTRARSAPGVRRATPLGSSLDDVADVHEHGERADEAPREDALIGTAGSHTPAADSRAEEPSGELAETEDTAD